MPSATTAAARVPVAACQPWLEASGIHAMRRNPSRYECAARGGRSYGLVLLLYLATLLADPVRKLATLPTATTGVVFALVGVIYVFLLPGVMSRARPTPPSLPVWLALLSLWCGIETVVERIPVGMALLGWFSYVFFVPLFYVGADLMASDRHCAKALRVVVISGGLVGLGAVASALLGQSAPAVLQPMVPSAGIHTFNTETVYLAPSVFATAEEASEHLLIAFFAWVALAQLPSGRMRRVPSAVFGAIIIVGLLATARRADLYVAVAGMVGMALLTFTAHTGSKHPRVSRSDRAHGRLASSLILAAAASIAFLAVLGASRLMPFLTSGQGGGAVLKLMFSPAHPTALTGQGPGTSTQGASVLGATSFHGVSSQGLYTAYSLNGRTFLTTEGGLTKAWLELGVMGVVLYGGVFASTLVPAIRRLGRLDPTGRALVALTIALGAIFLKGHQSLDNPLVQPLFWLVLGGGWGRMRASADARQADAETTPRSAPAANSAPAPALQTHPG